MQSMAINQSVFTYTDCGIESTNHLLCCPCHPTLCLAVTTEKFNATTAPCQGFCIPGITYCSSFLSLNNVLTYHCIADCSAFQCAPGHVCLGTQCRLFFGLVSCTHHWTQSLPVCYKHSDVQNCKYDRCEMSFVQLPCLQKKPTSCKVWGKAQETILSLLPEWCGWK